MGTPIIKYSKVSLEDRTIDDGLSGFNMQLSFRSVVSLWLVGIMVLTWVLMSEWLQDNAYVKSHEMLMRYLVVSAYTLSAVPAFVLERCFKHRSNSPTAGRSLFTRTALWTIFLSWTTMWAAGYIWYLSLRETSAALNNSLYQSQCVFVYLFSVLFLGESLTLQKTVACTISLLGVFAISWGGNSDDEAVQKSTFQGSIVCVMSAILFSVFEVSVKVMEEKHYDEGFLVRDSMYFLGYCGFWVLVLGPFLLFACHNFGFEHFDLPPNWESILIVLEVVVLDLVFNMALIVAIALSSPFFVALGLLAVIPGTFVSDYLFGKMKTSPGVMQISGTVLVVLGFLILNLNFSELCLPERNRSPSMQESAISLSIVTVPKPDLEVTLDNDDGEDVTIKLKDIDTN